MELKEAKEIVLEAWNKVCRIPKNRWTVDQLTNYVDKCCFIGHLNRLSTKNKDYFFSPSWLYVSNEQINFNRRVFTASNLLAEKLNIRLYKNGYDFIVNVNNGKIKTFQQDNPKDRVKAFIQDVRKIKV